MGVLLSEQTFFIKLTEQTFCFKIKKASNKLLFLKHFKIYLV